MKLAKKRYLLVKIDAAKAFSPVEAETAVRQAVLEAFGEKGLADAGARLKEFNSETQLALVRCSLSSQEEVIAALALKRFVNGQGIALRVQRIFGTLKKSRPLFPGSKPKARRRRNE